MFRKYARLMILIISLLTMGAGLIQTIKPVFILAIVKGDSAPAPAHFFAIIGMFMFLFGGLMIQSLYSAYPGKTVVLWCGLQKAGASIAVFIGIWKGLFSATAGLIAGFDLLSAIIFFIYLTNKDLDYNDKK
ncbi:MAG: hypothetical protein ABIQ31_25865 [Ferruginibacter sp.]